MIEFKAWNKASKEMIYPSSDAEAAGEYTFQIMLDGSFTVTQKTHTFSGLVDGPRDANNFELFFCIGLTTKDNKKLFSGDIIKDESGNKMTVGYGYYKGSKDSWGVEPTHFGCFVTFEDGGILALTQEGSGYAIASRSCEHLGHNYEQ